MTEFEYRDIICEMGLYGGLAEKARGRITSLAEWLYELKNASYIDQCRLFPIFSAFESYDDTLYTVTPFLKTVRRSGCQGYPDIEIPADAGDIYDKIYKLGTAVYEYAHKLVNENIAVSVEDIKKQLYGFL